MADMRTELDRHWHTDATRPGYAPPCDTCGGSGRIDTTPAGAAHPALESDADCPTCAGTGERSTP